MADWIDALADVPQAAQEQAFAEWIRNQERRPTPAGIRRRAMARVEKPRPEPVNRAANALAPISEAELRRRREIAREYGLPVLDDGSPVAQLQRVPKEAT